MQPIFKTTDPLINLEVARIYDLLDVPIGASFKFYGSIVPKRYLLLDGSRLLIAEYNLLYETVKDNAAFTFDAQYMTLPTVSDTIIKVT